MDIDSRWVSGSGYRPVRVRLSLQPPALAPADRRIEIRLRPRGNYYGTKAGAVRGMVELKQGDLYGEAILSVPQTTMWNSLSVDTWEDGWKHRDLSADHVGTSGRYYHATPDNSASIVVVHWAATDWTTSMAGGPNSFFSMPEKTNSLYLEPNLASYPDGSAWVPIVVPRTTPTVLSSNLNAMAMGRVGMGTDTRVHIDALPDIRVLAGRFPEASVNNYGTATDIFSSATPTNDSALGRLIGDLPNLELMPPNLLPDRWIDYTNIDIIMVSRAELQAIKSQFPEKWKALTHWLMSGTTLCVYDAGGSFEHLGAIETMFNAEPLVSEKMDKTYRGWDVPHAEDFTNQIEASQQSTQAWYQQQGLPKLPPAPSAPKSLFFVSRPIGQGRLVAISAQNPFPGTEYEWNWLLNSLPTRNWMSYQRIGASQFQDNVQFWTFLVEGIGKAPVKTFLGLITVFAIVIGPVNYYALQRRGRLYLLLVTVPVGAALVSTGLFVFAMLGDGFGTRLRLRSYTELDQKRGKAMTWSRQTYYAGFAPSRGLTFPATAAVYAIEHRPTANSGAEDTRRELVWDEQQNLVAGYFYSRTMAQFMVVEPQSTTAAIRIVESSDGTPPGVKNLLGTPIERLALRDSRGRLFEVVRLEPDEQAQATELIAGQGGKPDTSHSDVTEQGSFELTGNQPQKTMAKIVRPRVKDLGLAGGEWRDLYRTTRPAFPEGFNSNSMDDVSQFFSGRRFVQSGAAAIPVFETSVMETGIREVLDKDFAKIAPNRFVAILPRSPFVSIGTKPIREESGFHVIVGRW